MCKSIKTNNETVNATTNEEMVNMNTTITTNKNTVNNVNTKEEIIMNAPVKETNVTTNNTTVKEESIMDKKVKDYTLGGTINATNWQEFRAVMKEAGINTGTKTYAQLVEEYNALPKEETKSFTFTSADETDNSTVVPVGDFSSDKMPNETPENKTTNEETLNYYNKMAEYENAKKTYVKNQKTRAQINEEQWQALSQTTGLKFDTDTNNETEQTDTTTEEDKTNILVKNIVKSSFVATKGDNKGCRMITMKVLFAVIGSVYGKDCGKEFIQDKINELKTQGYIGFKRYESGALVFYPTVKAAVLAGHKFTDKVNA